MRNKYDYRVYDCNSSVCKFVGSYSSLNSAKNHVFTLGEKYSERRFYVIEVYNNFTNRVCKIHYSSTSRFYDESVSCYFHHICLDYGKMPQHESFFYWGIDFCGVEYEKHEKQ